MNTGFKLTLAFKNNSEPKSFKHMQHTAYRLRIAIQLLFEKQIVFLIEAEMRSNLFKKCTGISDWAGITDIITPIT